MVRKRHPVRYYDVDGKRLPSVTSVLGRTDPIFNPSKQSGLDWWRRNEPNHEKIVDDACRRGSILHSEIELALTGTQSATYSVQEWADHNIPDYLTQLMPFIQEVKDSEPEVEKVVTHPAGYAGTADLICDWQGIPTIVDFKTTRHHADVGEKEKPRSYYKSAEVQVSAYAAAYNQSTTRPIEQGLIVVAYSWREPQLIELDTDALISRVTEFQERLEVFKVLEGG